jgi:hypothetical protein
MPCFRPLARLAVILPLVLGLGGCSNGGLAGFLRTSGATSTPDEFLVLPTRPLEIPDNLSALPPPTPGTVNRVDYQPERIAVAGLTGKDVPLTTTSGTALLARAGAGSANPQIRVITAEEDADYRSVNKGRLLERWFSRDKEAVVYRSMTLDAAAAYDEMRSRGVEVSPPPPDLLQ